MSHELFHDVTDTRPRAGRAAGGTLAVSVLAHAAILAAVVVVPLLATDTMPTLADPLDSFIPVAPPPPPAPAPAVDRTPATRGDTPPDRMPLAPPDEIRPEDPRPSRSDFLIDDGGPTPPGDVGDVIDGTGTRVSQPTPPPPPPVPDRPIRVTAINMPTKVHDVAPIYPAIAQRASIEGVVIIEAVIAVDGSVRDARVLRSVPLLDRAALDAVKQWRYVPTRLNGVAVPVIVTVTVQFRLQR